MDSSARGVAGGVCVGATAAGAAKSCACSQLPIWAHRPSHDNEPQL